MTAVEKFLTYLRRKVRVLAVLTCAFVAVGVASLVESSAHRALDPLSGATFIMAAVSGYLSLDGRGVAQKVERLSKFEGRPFELTARPSDVSGNATRLPSGVLATMTELDDPAATVAEMRSRWFTPGIAQQPAGRATLFGPLEIGSAVLAVGDKGGLLGTVTSVRSLAEDSSRVR